MPSLRKLKKFAAAKPMFKVSPDQLEKSRTFAERQLRYNILSAAYGYRVATQVFNDADPQISRGVDVMPRARDLALAASRARSWMILDADNRR
jgi:peroxiredoxin